MNNYLSLKEYLDKNPPTINCEFDLFPLKPNTVKFPLYGRHIVGAVLFADLPGYSTFAQNFSPEECAYMTNHFFSWINATAIQLYGGLIDKFIGDEIMVIFSPEFHNSDPLESAIRTAKAIFESDIFAFEPKIGIATGEFLISAVGSHMKFDVSAIGHVVNLAARCVSKAKRTLIKIATKDKQLIEKIFDDKVKWKIEGPKIEKFKNVNEVEG